MTTAKLFLTTTDVARILGEERARVAGRDPLTAAPLAERTVREYVAQSAPGGSYEDHPVPPPTYAQRTLTWAPGPGETVHDVELSWRAWARGRKGQGAGGGPKITHPLVQCLCGCEQMVPASKKHCAAERARRSAAYQQRVRR